MAALTDAGEALSLLVLEVFRANGLLLEAGDRLSGPAGLTSARWQVLGVVDHGPATVAAVARAMGLTRQSVRQTADALAADGFVAYADNPQHRTARLVALTAKGRAALRQVERRQAAWANRLAARLEPGLVRASLGGLRALRERLDERAPGALADEAPPPAGAGGRAPGGKGERPPTASEMTIPCLPCASLEQTLPFYQALGFEITHTQTKPNVYAALRRGGVHLHFFGLKHIDPAAAYSTCLVIVPEVESLHRAFTEALRRHCGKLPVIGAPRISRMKPGQSRFTVVDPAGNSVIFIKRDAPDGDDEGDRDLSAESRLERARRTAARLRDFRNDDEAAAKVLDVALRRPDGGSVFDRVRALAARAELAVALRDAPRARSLRAELATLAPALSAGERARIADEFDAADRLERGLVDSDDDRP